MKCNIVYGSGNAGVMVKGVVVWVLGPTEPGLGSGTFPVYSLHFESRTSM